ncbi:MAG: HIT family protein [Limnochordia bacterium]
MSQQIPCTFCEIVNGGSPASIVYENHSVLALMNLRQANPGHVLVIPKKHVTYLYELDMSLVSEIFRCVTVVARAIQERFRPEGLTIWQSNGSAAGQEIPHVHVHLLPRRMGDGHVTFYPDVPPLMDRVQLDALAAELRRYIKE